MIRYIPAGRNGDYGACRLCGARYGQDFTKRSACDASTCRYCGKRQCMINGLGHGACGFCLVGVLPGWSRIPERCDYKDCSAVAVAFGKNGKRGVCRAHAERQYGSAYLDLAAQPKRSRALDDAGHIFSEVHDELAEKLT